MYKNKHFNKKKLKNLKKINSFTLELAVAILNSLKVSKVSSFWWAPKDNVEIPPTKFV